MHRTVARIASIVVPLAALVLASAGDAPPGDAPPGDAPRVGVHADSGVAVTAVRDAFYGFVVGDAAMVLEAMERVERNCRRLQDDDREALGSHVVIYDEAFHAAVDVTRERSRQGDLERAYEQFVWVQRACVKCHDLARESGALPPQRRPPPSGPSGVN